jgi:hypothetical protein
MKICLLFSLFFLTQNVFSQDTLTKKDFLTGGKFLGLNFTDREIDSMYGSVRNTVGEVKKMHNLHLDNSVPMTLTHSPVLPGMKFNTKQQAVKWGIPKNVNLPANKNDLIFLHLQLHRYPALKDLRDK